MSLKKFVRSLVVLSIGAFPGHLIAADTRPPGAAHARFMTPSRATKKNTAMPRLADPAQDTLISEILGVATSPRPAKSKGDAAGESIFACVAAKKQPAAEESAGSQRPPASPVFSGRIIGVHLDTSTVDIEFEGRRTTTVGSKFSVFHDYALSTEYLGNLEIVYLAGGNRAIAKPGGRTDITRMGKGDRVNGRVVASKDSMSAPRPIENRSCSKPSTDGMPVPPLETAAPYLPEEPPPPEPPAPAPDISRKDAKPNSQPIIRSMCKASPVTPRYKARKASAVRSTPSKQALTDPLPPPLPITADLTAQSAAPPKWIGLSATSWAALLKSNSRSQETASLASQEATVPFAGKPSAKSLWCAVKPKPAAVSRPLPMSASKSSLAPRGVPLAAKVPPTSMLLFEE